MSASKSLPPRPSLDSLRKRAKKIARAQSISLREAQLAIARDYGFAGWQDLTAEVHARLGKGLQHAIAQARRMIHDNDVDGLTALLAEYPALLSWRGADDEHDALLAFATSAYGDAFGPEREAWFTRKACAEVLIDAGAVVTPSILEGLLRSRAVGLLQLFHRKNLLPGMLKFLAALGDLDAVRAALVNDGDDRFVVREAFFVACRFTHDRVAALLLDRCLALEPELRQQIDGSVGRDAVIASLVDKESLDLGDAAIIGPWRAFVMSRIVAAIHDDDRPAFDGWLMREPWLLDDAVMWFQNRIIEVATLNDRGALIAALLDRGPAILRRQPPPPSQAMEIAFTYAKLHLLTLLTQIWKVPDDLPHAAGLGNLARVRAWFDESGEPALGDVAHHYPFSDEHARRHARDLHWRPAPSRVLDVALAYAVINRQFDVADFLLQHGADVNTDWNSHEPASILHHLVFQPEPYEPMQFLIDRGIDLTIRDYRWGATAKGWAQHALQDETMARFLDEAERTR